MKIIKKLSIILLITVQFISCTTNDPKGTDISNTFLTATFDSAIKSITVTVNSSKKVIIKNFIPTGGSGTFQKTETNDPIFGKGSSLIVNADKGGYFTFTLYPSQPFLFVTQTVTNESSDVLDIEKLNPVSFDVDLGKPVNELKTLGTGGLLEADKNPGSYVFLTTVDPETRNGVVSGWLTNEKGSGVLFSNINDGKVVIKPQIDYGHFRLPAGKEEATETLLIGYFNDARIGEELFADALAKYNKINLKEQKAVYCTWYSEKHGGAGSEASSIELAKFIAKELKPFGLGVLQIDDQWQDGGSYNGPARGFNRSRKIALEGAVINGTAKQGFPANYPNGMETTANAIKNEGLTAGIWWMPFARNHQDPEYNDRQHWFGYRTNGKHFETAWGGTSLDLTHPEVQNHISEVSKTMQNWGFDYFKMDGLWTGTVTEQVYINDGYKNDSIGNSKPLFNPIITQIEAFRNGLKIIRNATENKVFLSGCCASQNMRSFGASIGLVDAMRIGPDFNHDGESIRTGAIRASRLYFLNGRIWWNDPDPSMLRESGKSNADPSATGIGSLTRARLLPSFVAISGQFFLSSDWLPDLPNDRIEIMKRCMASHSGTARPVDAFDKVLPSIWLATDKKSGTSRNVIGLFNWATNSENIGCSLDWAGIDGNKTYYAFDFWENKPLAEISSGSIKANLPSESCQIIALREKSDHPLVVSTSQHVTQGMIDLHEENWNNETLTGTSKIIANDPYEIRIAGLNDGGKWMVDKASLLENSSMATIEVLPLKEEGWLRIVIKSEESLEIKWKLIFNN